MNQQSKSNSPGLVSGSWISIVHWSDIEARYWQQEILRFEESHWRQLIQGIRSLGMDTLVIQEVIRNQMYVDQHRIEEEGYPGRAFFPSTFCPRRFETACGDPLEVILDEADRLGMQVFAGVGLYAWFDFSKSSLRWHIDLTQELWNRYGHHQSLYGWYISEETFGNLGMLERHRSDLIDFFAEYKSFAHSTFPRMPVMLAPNCHGIRQSLNLWPRLLEHLDILCPFGFHRMPAGDLTGPEAARLLGQLCRESGCRLWMDMEVFEFETDAFPSPLIPRDIASIIADLRTYTEFEKILCYQYPGLMNAPWAQIKPGGERTVRLYKDYQNYYQKVQQELNDASSS